MNIDKIGRISGSGYEPKKTVPSVKSETSLGSDSVSISETAKQLAMQVKLSQEISAITQKILSEPDNQERADRIRDIKTKLKNGEYENLSPEVLDKISERITEVFLG